MTSGNERPWWRTVRLTRRGRQVRAVAALLLGVLVLSMLVRACSGGRQDTAVPAPAPVAPASGTGSSPSPSAAPTSTSPGPQPSRDGSTTPSPSTSASPSGWGEGDDVSGMKHTGLLGKGTWRRATIAVAPRVHEPVVRRFVVQTEDGTGLDPDAAARQVVSILDDGRGWTGFHGVSFELVTDPRRADFTVYLASPGRVQRMCPLDVKMTWSCSAGRNVILNTDRWLYMTPTYRDLADYRAYMVNHEVGHYIGLGHRPCPGPGRPAPVMMQQSKGLNGCTANPWPTSEER